MNCPFCAEEIKDAASVCRYCGRDLVSVRPLLDANAALSKQIDDLKQQFDALAEAQSQVHRHVGMGDGKIPSIHRASAVALLLVWVFVAGLFIAAVKQHGGELSLVYATSALIVVPMIFGFLCQNIKTRPAASDLGVALAVSTVALIDPLGVARRISHSPGLGPRPRTWRPAARYLGSVYLQRCNDLLQLQRGGFLPLSAAGQPS